MVQGAKVNACFLMIRSLFEGEMAKYCVLFLLINMFFFIYCCENVFTVNCTILQLRSTLSNR